MNVNMKILGFLLMMLPGVSFAQKPTMFLNIDGVEGESKEKQDAAHRPTVVRLAYRM